MIEAVTIGRLLVQHQNPLTSDRTWFEPERRGALEWYMEGPPGYYQEIQYEVWIPLQGGAHWRKVNPSRTWLIAGDDLTVTFNQPVDLPHINPPVIGKITGKVHIVIPKEPRTWTKTNTTN